MLIFDLYFQSVPLDNDKTVANLIPSILAENDVW